MATINQSIVLIALPDIFRGIGLNPLSPGNTSYLLWMFMGFLVVSAVLVVSFGRLGDMFGRVRMYNIGFAIFSVASIFLTLTWMHGTSGALWLIIWRVVQGIGGAFLFANSTAILTDAFPANQRGTALGMNSIAAIAGSFVGLLLGGVLAPINWHYVFLVSAPIRAFAAGNVANLMLALGRGGMQFMLIIWLQGIWLPLHGYSFSQTPLWAGIYLVPATIGFLISAPLSGVFSDRYGAKAFTVGGSLLTALTFFILLFLPVDFTYWEFALIIAFNGFGSGLFASPNRAEMMNAVPANQRGAAGGMIATFMNTSFVLSIGVFFSLMVAGLSSKLPGTLSGGLVAQGIPASAAAQISHLPPIGVLFAAFLGYNPMQQLLGPLLGHLPAGHAAYVTGRQFFPHLITAPFHDGLGVAFAFAIAASLIAAVASLLTGPRPRPGAAPEPLGAELAAVAGDAGIEPSEIVGPGPEAEEARGPDGTDGRGNGQSPAVTKSAGTEPG